MAVDFDPAAYARWFETDLGRRVWDDERRAIDRVTGPVAGFRVLDAGAGEGRLAVELARDGAVVTGVDRSAGMLRAARRRSAPSWGRLGWVRADIAALPLRSGTFDAVLGVTVLCFARAPEALVRELARVARPGGRVVIGELGRWSVWALWRRLRGWLRGGTWAAAHFWTQHDLRALLRRAGLRPAVAAAAVFYPPSAFLARLFRRVDGPLGRRLSLGAAFLALAGEKGVAPREDPHGDPRTHAQALHA